MGRRSVAELLTEAIKDSGLSLGDIVKGVHHKGYFVNKSTLSRWAAGQTQPGLKNLECLRCLPEVLNMRADLRREFQRALNEFLGLRPTVRGQALVRYREDTFGELAYFVGREAEIQRLVSLTHQRQSAVITGLGGMGKTTLARQVLQLQATQFLHGCRALQVYAHHQLADIVRWVAQALDVTLPETMLHPTSVGLALEELRLEIGGTDVLFLLDNVMADEQVERLIHGLPNLTWLLTTRQQVHLAGLTTLKLLPPTTTDATQMFLHYAELSDNAGISPVAEVIVTRLGRWPLALRSAARLMTTWAVGNVHDLLTWLETYGLSGLQHEPGRLAQFFIHLLDQQSAECQAVFELCGAFAYPRISRRLFKTLLNDLGLAAHWLSHLYHLSLVSWEVDEAHFDLHPLLHEHARQRFQASPTRPAIQHWFAQRYAEFAARSHHQHLQLREEWDNLLLAVEFAVLAQDWPTVLDFYAPISTQLWMQGDTLRYQQYEEIFRTAARLSNHQNIEAAILSELGWLWMKQHDLEAAHGFLAQAQSLHDRLPDNPLGQARVRRYRAILALLVNDLPLAEQCLKEALTRLPEDQANEEQLTLTRALIHSAQTKVAFRAGRLTEAETLARQVVDLCQQATVAGQVCLPGLQLQLGDVLFDLGEIEAAQAEWHTAANFPTPDFVDDSAVAGASERLARLAASQHQVDLALRHAQAARHWYARRGLPEHCERVEHLIHELEAGQTGQRVFTTALTQERLMRP